MSHSDRNLFIKAIVPLYFGFESSAFDTTFHLQPFNIPTSSMSGATQSSSRDETYSALGWLTLKNQHSTERVSSWAVAAASNLAAEGVLCGLSCLKTPSAKMTLTRGGKTVRKCHFHFCRFCGFEGLLRLNSSCGSSESLRPLLFTPVCPTHRLHTANFPKAGRHRSGLILTAKDEKLLQDKRLVPLSWSEHNCKMFFYPIKSMTTNGMY